jgi:hypothetical protein
MRKKNRTWGSRRVASRAPAAPAPAPAPAPAVPAAAIAAVAAAAAVPAAVAVAAAVSVVVGCVEVMEVVAFGRVKGGRGGRGRVRGVHVVLKQQPLV